MRTNKKCNIVGSGGGKSGTDFGVDRGPNRRVDEGMVELTSGETCGSSLCVGRCSDSRGLLVVSV